jgi:energy-coupling factor transporter ATP-binding protein EcfA2
MAGTVDLIRDWATQLDYWEEAALEKVAAGTALTEADYQDLLDLFMQDACLIAKPATHRPPLTFPTKLASVSNTAGLILERLFNLRNVNALPAAQEIKFGRQLTIIYGSNGSGKTSYARPLGCAAFARGDREVLPDARKANTNAVPQADIEISKNGANRTVTWVNGKRCAELAAVYVFDGTSINAHLTRPNALSFSPAGLAVLTKLAEVTDEVRNRLRKVIEAKSEEHHFAAFFPGDSWVSREVASLSGRTDVTRLEQAAALSEDDERRIAELGQQIAILKSRNIHDRISALTQEVKDLERLNVQLSASSRALGLDAERQTKDLIAELGIRREEAERLGADQFRFDPFKQIGTDVWREFIHAAKALADAEAQRGTSYPQPGDPCLFCRQALSPQALQLIDRLWEFLTSDAPARFESAQTACKTLVTKFDAVSFSYFGPDSAARRILETEAPELVTAVDAFLAACSTRSRELARALQTEIVPESTGVVIPDMQAIQTAVERRKKHVADLETTDVQKELAALEAPERELQHRHALGGHLAAMKVWIEGQRWATRAQKAVGSTRHITAKYNELFKALVTDQYRDTFQALLQKLKHNLKLTIETRGQKGETVRQIVLSPEAFAQKVAVDKILSDGEKRAVALADFITEVALDTSSNAIVLDDPVSSFDSDSKDAVAQVLAEQASKRQVIVFTHDLAFVYALKVKAKQMSIGVVSHWVRAEHGQPGYVYLDNSPLCEGDYKSAKIARDCYRKAKDAPPAEQERELQQGFGALRASYEAFVIYDLFNEVVKRFEERVSFDRLKEVNLDREVVDRVVEKLGTLSRYIDAHLHSDIFAAEKPTPEMLLDEINAFEELRKTHKDSKKTTAAIVAKAPMKTAAPSSAAATDATSTPSQPKPHAVN